MKAAISLIILAVHLLQTCSSFLTIKTPFTHDYSNASPIWRSMGQGWHDKDLQQQSPDLTKVPSFASDGNYIWTQSSLSGLEFNRYRSFETPYIAGVDNSTKFHFRYWFSTSQPSAKSGIRFYVNVSTVLIGTVNTSANEWRDFTIDCQYHECCARNSGSCKMDIHVMASVGDKEGDGLVAIRCVSTVDDGCGPLSVTLSSRPSNVTTSRIFRSTMSTIEFSTVPETAATVTETAATVPETAATVPMSATTVTTETPAKDDANHSGLSGLSDYTDWGKTITVCLVITIILMIISILLRLYFTCINSSYKRLISDKNNQSDVNSIL